MWPLEHAAGREPAERQLAEGRLQVAAYDGGARRVRPGLVEPVAASSASPSDLAAEGAPGELPVSAEASARASGSWSAYASG